jgi:hypothetical protein
LNLIGSPGEGTSRLEYRPTETCREAGGQRRRVADNSVTHLAGEAYLYGFPLVFNLDQVTRYVTTGVGSNPQASFNQFSHARALATPKVTFVTINNDTGYSMAQLDLSVGPLRLHVPDTDGRYYVLQFVDTWTNNFAYVGHRATGTGEGDFLLVSFDWSGEAPSGATVIRVPTRVASIVGRWACAGDEDLPAVHALPEGTTLQAVEVDASPIGIPSPDAAVPDDLQFLEKLRLWSQAFPPAPRDQPLQSSLGPVGITQSQSPYLAAEPSYASALTAGLDAGQAALDNILGSGSGDSSPEVNGWRLTMHVFDYNLDYFEVGALDDPAVKITDPKVRIAERAGAAKAGLWASFHRLAPLSGAAAAPAWKT